jgi:hypothetical protein
VFERPADVHYRCTALADELITYFRESLLRKRQPFLSIPSANHPGNYGEEHAEREKGKREGDRTAAAQIFQ